MVVREEQVTALIELLKGRGWVRAKEFPVEWSERSIRAVASASKGEVISGQKGYALSREATLADCWKSRDWLLSQAKDMMRRVTEIDRVLHRREERI